MATKAQPTRIGPFSGGLNTYSDPSAIADEDAVELINFDVDLDGSLISRPPFVPTASAGGRYNNRLLGIYTTTAGTSYAIFSMRDTAGTGIYTSYYNLNTGAFGTVTATVKAAAVVQYQNKLWLIAEPGSANPGGSWDGTTFTAVAALPKGVSATVYKERIFVASGALDTTNPSRVYFSGPANPTSWTGTDFFDVNNGDGQPIVSIYSYQGSIVIFKKRSTYVYAYETSPTKGQVQSVSASMGLQNSDCLAESENTLYVMFENNLYSISNWNWEQVNVKVPFTYNNNFVGYTHNDFSVSAVGNRIIARYYDNYYVYGTKTRTFTLWTNSRAPDKMLKSPIVDSATGIETYVCGNYVIYNTPTTNAGVLYLFKDAYTATDIEQFNVSLKSKIYNFNVPYSYKRLMWWGADILSKSALNAVVSPIVYATPVYIKTIQGQPISNYIDRPIGRLLDVNIDVSDSADIKNPAGVRMFVKYLKSLRFRQVQFQLSSAVDGSTKTGPLRIYSLTAYVANKETVRDKIN